VATRDKLFRLLLTFPRFGQKLRFESSAEQAVDNRQAAALDQGHAV
jgi:hypothetical protein